MSLEACGSLVTQHVGIDEGRGRAAQLDPGIEEDAQGKGAKEAQPTDGQSRNNAWRPGAWQDTALGTDLSSEIRGTHGQEWGGRTARTISAAQDIRTRTHGKRWVSDHRS